MKYLFLLLITNIGMTQECPSTHVQLLPEELTERQSQLQDSLDDCPNLTDAINLAKVYLEQKDPIIAEEVMLDALNDLVKSDKDRIYWIQNSIDNALFSKNTCQASQFLNELSFMPQEQTEYNKYRIKLLNSTKDQVLNSQTIGCALTESRSISFRGMKIKPKIDLAIHFEFNSDQLTAKGKQQSLQLATALKKLSKSHLILIGHTDSIGSDTYNMDLSQRRSQSVKNYLISFESDLNKRITTQGMGESQLLSQGTSNNDHQLNRRVEIQIQ